MAEDPLSEVRFRWVRQMETLGYGNEVAERIAFLEAQGSRLMLTDDAARTALFDALRRHRTDVCFLDPLVSLHDRDENSNAQMRAVLDLLAPFQEESACTFVIAHHEPKSPENNSSASRGASAIRDWSRTHLRLTAQGGDDDGTRRFELALDKANYGGTVYNLTLERKQDSYIFVPVVEVTVTPRDVWDVVGSEGGWLEDIKALLVERFNISEVTARRAIKKAETTKIVEAENRLNPETGRKKSYLVRGGAE
jgi:RecA-family ATPase